MGQWKYCNSRDTRSGKPVKQEVVANEWDIWNWEFGDARTYW